MAKTRSKSIYYLLLFSVIIIWALDPGIYSFFYETYSATVVCAICAVMSFAFFLCLCFKKLKNLNKDYLKIAVPIGLLNSLAGLLQRIGLQYTSPANYAFLEHLSVAVVPLLMFVLVRKKPTILTGASVILCLAGCFILSGMGLNGFNGGIGDILCALAGMVYGACVVAINLYAKKLDSGLYMLVFLFVYSITALLTVWLLDNVTVGDVALETARFVLDIKLLIPLALFGLVSVGITWLMRTEAIKHLEPTFVAIVSPFTAVLAAIISIVSGTDELSARVVIGAVLVLAAALLSGISDAKEEA